MDNDGHAEYTVPGDALLSRDNLYIRNALIQNFTENRGKLFQATGDVDYDLDGFLSNIATGVRYAHRPAEEQAVNLNQATPGDPKSPRLNPSHHCATRMPTSS